MRRQTITPILGDQKLYQRPDTPLLWPSPGLALVSHRPALLELRAQMQFCLSIPPPPRRRLSGLASRQPLSPRVLCLSQHRPPSEMASPPLRNLSVPGDVTSSVKEGPSCPHPLSAEFPPQIPMTMAWKDSPDGCGAGARPAREGGLPGPLRWSG